MKVKTVVLIVTALAVFQINYAMAQSKTELTKITDSVYSYVGVPVGSQGNVFSANAGIIIGKDAVLVVDTLTSNEEAEAFYKNIQKITNKPVRYAVNTHYHLDHSLGNSFFGDRGVQIISHVKCRDTVIAGGEKTLENPAMFGLSEDFWKNTRIAVPGIAFEREMIVDLGDIIVKLIHSGMKSHSAGSIIVHVPKEDVLFTGDILFTDYHPYLAEGDLPGWKKNLDLIRGMNVKHIIPGHGPLSTNKDIEDMSTYLTVFDKKATELSDVEKNIEKLTAEMLQTIPQRSNGDFIIPMNLKARYLDKNEKGQHKY